MNTKQVEELVGVSRQNIRYYEKEGLLTPFREKGNSYRDYSQEDVERLKLIKMLRMLDMPLKDIALVLNNEVPLQDAVAVRQKELLEQQKKLQAAIDICNLFIMGQRQRIAVERILGLSRRECSISSLAGLLLIATAGIGMKVPIRHF